MYCPMRKRERERKIPTHNLYAHTVHLFLTHQNTTYISQLSTHLNVVKRIYLICWQLYINIFSWCACICALMLPIHCRPINSKQISFIVVYWTHCLGSFCFIFRFNCKILSLVWCEIACSCIARDNRNRKTAREREKNKTKSTTS